ncbi:hypothetical protein ACFY04_37605 [Streptomyces sp. NPDC001549]|uniref:hypothetical protein n=1 Tax=Streptomyces sp. NPDC001549 TaxID=3364586 RepID=UPI0036AF14FA
MAALRSRTRFGVTFRAHVPVGAGAVVDLNADGVISPEEHRRLVETWNGRPADLDGVFELLAPEGAGHLGRERFALLWRQFWISDDPADPGNMLCGRILGPR